ncbi:MAG: hypothetical protein QXI48_03075 [Candidatus Bathyarchaeia archaeon]
MMVQKFEIWVSPHNLRIAYERVADFLKKADFDNLYLNIRRDLGGLIEDLALGAPYEKFIEEIKRLKILRENVDYWEKTIKPILLVLRGIKLKRPSLRIICYKNPVFDDLFVREAEEIAILIFRVNSTGKVDVKEWRNLLYRIINEATESGEDEANYILRTYSENANRGRTICLTDFSGKHLLKSIRSVGVDAIIRYIISPYHFAPLETLMREMVVLLRKGFAISDERLIKLVKLHAEYIREYVLTSSEYDEAYERWIKDERFKNY